MNLEDGAKVTSVMFFNPCRCPPVPVRAVNTSALAVAKYTDVHPALGTSKQKLVCPGIKPRGAGSASFSHIPTTYTLYTNL